VECGVRFADEHMWRISQRSTSRIQAFRDLDGRGLVLITKRVGDTGPSHVNHAESFRDAAWKEFFAADPAPPVLFFNLIDPDLRVHDDAEIVSIDFDASSRFERLRDATTAETTALTQLGAQWDEGSGFVPHVPPPPTHVLVLRKVAVRDLPPSDLFRDMTDYMDEDWNRATAVALDAQCLAAGIPGGTPRSIADAARSLWNDPIHLEREAGQQVRFGNGQHRAEAMRRQGVAETVVQEVRPIDAAPLAGEIRIVGPAY